MKFKQSHFLPDDFTLSLRALLTFPILPHPVSLLESYVALPASGMQHGFFYTIFPTVYNHQTTDVQIHITYRERFKKIQNRTFEIFSITYIPSLSLSPSPSPILIPLTYFSCLKSLCSLSPFLFTFFFLSLSPTTDKRPRPAILKHRRNIKKWVIFATVSRE